MAEEVPCSINPKFRGTVQWLRPSWATPPTQEPAQQWSDQHETRISKGFPVSQDRQTDTDSKKYHTTQRSEPYPPEKHKIIFNHVFQNKQYSHFISTFPQEVQ